MLRSKMVNVAPARLDSAQESATPAAVMNLRQRSSSSPAPKKGVRVPQLPRGFFGTRDLEAPKEHRGAWEPRVRAASGIAELRSR